MTTCRLLAVAATLLACLPAVAAEAQKDVRPLVFGMTRPYGVAAGVESAKHIEGFFKSSGIPVRMRMHSSYEELANAIAKGEVDLAWVTPLGYVRASEHNFVRMIRKSVRHGLPWFRSVFFVRADSDIRKLEDLKGKRIAWGAEWSTSGNVFPRAFLIEKKLDAAKFLGSQVTLGDHFEVCKAVYDGTVDVGASFADDRPDLAEQELDGCKPKYTEKLGEFRIIQQTERIPNDLVVARPGLDAEIARQVGAALDTLKEDDKAMKDGFRCVGFEPGKDSEYDIVRKMVKIVKRGK